MRALGRAATGPCRIYFTGGATAVLHGWRETTIDVDLRMVPERDEIFRAIATIKDELSINVELASPPDFIPVPDGWTERGIYIDRAGQIDFFHFELGAQAVAKSVRGHPQDLADVAAMLELGLVTHASAWAFWSRAAPGILRYPSLNLADVERALTCVFGDRAIS